MTNSVAPTSEAIKCDSVSAEHKKLGRPWFAGEVRILVPVSCPLPRGPWFYLCDHQNIVMSFEVQFPDLLHRFPF